MLSISLAWLLLGKILSPFLILSQSIVPEDLGGIATVDSANLDNIPLS